jgi:hypothetical protein
MSLRSFWSWDDHSQSEHWNPPLNVRDVVGMTWRLPALVVEMLWFSFRHITSKKYRMKVAGTYNRAMFGDIPTSQIYVQEGGQMRQLREDERTWPE